jgi:hypothetical protein
MRKSKDRKRLKKITAKTVTKTNKDKKDKARANKAKLEQWRELPEDKWAEARKKHSDTTKAQEA